MKKQLFALLFALSASAGIMYAGSGISVKDNSISDWDALPSEYVFEATCPAGALWTGVSKLMVYADDEYINYAVFYDSAMMSKHSWTDAMQIFINADNSDQTGGYYEFFADAAVDIMLEGNLFDEAGSPIPYSPAVYQWAGPEGGEPSSRVGDWSNVWNLLVFSINGESQIIGNSIIEGRLMRQYIPWNTWSDKFRIGISVQQNWEPIGYLPQGISPDGNLIGRTSQLEVTFAPSSSSQEPIILSDTVCSSEDVYYWRNSPIYYSGMIDTIWYNENSFMCYRHADFQIYRQTVKIAAGTDSIYQLELFWAPSSYYVGYYKIESGTIMDIHGRTITESGIYRDTIQNSYGCDSIDEWHFDFYEVVNITQDASICQGESYLFGGRELSSAGSYIWKYSKDTIYTLNLTVHPVRVTEISVPIYEGQPVMYNGRLYEFPGAYIDTFTTVDGCDSLVRTHIEDLRYMITVVAEDPTMGIVIGGGIYFPDQPITIMATPKKDCEFVQWSDGNKLNPRTFRAHADSVFTAVFRRNVPVPQVVCSDTMYFASADTNVLATRVYNPSEIQPYDKLIIATVDNKNVMGFQFVEGAEIRNFRLAVDYSKNMNISNVSVVEVVPNGGNYRLRVTDGELAPRCEDCTSATNQLYATETGADWNFAEYDSALVPEALNYDKRMILYNEESKRFSSYRQLTSVDRRQTTIFKLHMPRNIPQTPEAVDADLAVLIEKDAPMDSISVDVEPKDTVAVISAPYVDFVHTYTLIVWADEARTQVFMIITYDAEGHQLSATRPESVRRRAPQAASISFEIGDLEPTKEYPYTLVACEDDGSILTSLNSSFTTTDGTEGIRNVFNKQSQIVKFLLNGQLLILRGDKIYTITGQEVR